MFDAALPGSVHRWDRRRPVCGSTGSLYHCRPTLRMVEKVSSPSEFLESSRECTVTGYGPSVDRRGVDATIVPHSENLRKSSPAQVYDLTYGCATCTICGPTVCRSRSLRLGLKIPSRFKLNSFI